MLQLAATEIEKEAAAKEVEKQNYLAEHCPPLSLPGSMQELQVQASLTLSVVEQKILGSIMDLDQCSLLDPLLTCITLEPVGHAAGLRGRWGLSAKTGVCLAGKMCFK